jgi:diguanylate cyclase (GGDEF)-like protein
LVGDCILKELAKLLLNNFRKRDIIVRYGGEEFIVVMPFTPMDSACKKMEEIRKKIEEHTFCQSRNLNLKVTVSIGVTEYRDSMRIEEFISKADENLYTAKRSGRNKVVCR